MNKQELIETLEEIRANIDRDIEIGDRTVFSQGKKDAYNNVIGLAKQLDEPIKVVVPKFVAEWLDKHKYSTDIIDLFLSVEYATDSDGFIAEKWEYSGEFYDWLSDNADIQFTLCDAMRYGYEVEKEQLYYVFDTTTKQYLGVDKVLNKAFWLSSQNSGARTPLTEQEIKAIDERYWDFALKVGEEQMLLEELKFTTPKQKELFKSIVEDKRRLLDNEIEKLYEQYFKPADSRKIENLINVKMEAE